MKAVLVPDIVLPTGKTIRETNLETPHAIPINTLVEVTGSSCVDCYNGLRAFVIHHGRDYDGTITHAFEELAKFYKVLIDCGHTVILCTMRYESEPVSPLVIQRFPGIQIYYSGRKSKLQYLKDLGIEVNIWIDDNPHFILIDAAS
jgi:hypothetical protein